MDGHGIRFILVLVIKGLIIHRRLLLLILRRGLLKGSWRHLHWLNLSLRLGMSKLRGGSSRRGLFHFLHIYVFRLRLDLNSSLKGSSFLKIIHWVEGLWLCLRRSWASWRVLVSRWRLPLRGGWRFQTVLLKILEIGLRWFLRGFTFQPLPPFFFPQLVSLLLSIFHTLDKLLVLEVIELRST